MAKIIKNQIVPTIYSNLTQTAAFMGVNETGVLNDITLNKKFNTHYDYELTDEDNRKAQYITIGNGGHKFHALESGFPTFTGIDHLPKHAALYNHIPLIARPIDHDLSPSEREKYRMRVIEEHDGLQYVMYYVLKLDFDSVIPTVEYRTVTDGEVSATPFEPSINDLNPTPPVLDTNEVLTTNGDYLAVTAKTLFKLDNNAVREVIEACKIKFGDERYAIISEMAYCMGIDKTLPGVFSDNTSTYTEVVGCQPAAFISSIILLNHLNEGLEMIMDVGSIDPLLTVKDDTGSLVD